MISDQKKHSKLETAVRSALRSHVHGLKVQSTVGNLPPFAAKFNFAFDPKQYTFGIGHSVFDRRSLVQHYYIAYNILSPKEERYLVQMSNATSDPRYSSNSAYLLSQHIRIVDDERVKAGSDCHAKEHHHNAEIDAILNKCRSEFWWPVLRVLLAALRKPSSSPQEQQLRRLGDDILRYVCSFLVAGLDDSSPKRFT
mmetsp:Transcript_19601/g.27604  ORF Transcript_19601/g.27604 Transcript_19601/m.27604 type:complete len:197 (+) Transcript_19601:88-678(+)